MSVGVATLDFGANAGAATDHATVDVTGLAGLSSGTHMEGFLQSDSTALNDAEGHRFGAAVIQLVCEFLSASSFRIHGYSTVGKIWGTFTTHWATA